MASPRTTIIVLLLILAVAIMFLVVGQGLGGQQPAAPSEADIDALKEKFLGSPARVQWPPGVSCPPTVGIPSGGRCERDIPKGGGLLTLRKVSIWVPAATAMLIEFRSASSSKTITLDLTETDPEKRNPSKPAELSVDSKGGQLTLKCVAAPPNSTCKPQVQ